MAEAHAVARAIEVRVSGPVRTRRGVIAEAVRLLTDQGIGVDDINLRRPTLDDVFLSLTGHAAEEDTTTEEEDAS